MSKRKNRRNKNKQPTPSTLMPGPSLTSKAQTPAKDTAPLIKTIVDAAAGKLSDSDSVPATDVSPPAVPEEAITETEMQEAWSKLTLAEERDRLGRQTLDGGITKLETDKAALGDEQKALKSGLAALADREEALQVQEKAQLEEAELLAAKRADAEAGFLVAHRDSIANLDETINQLSDGVASQMAKLAEKRKELVDDVAAAHDAALAEERQEIETIQRELKRTKRQVEWDSEDLEDRISAAHDRAKSEVAGQVEVLEIRCQDLAERLKAAREERNRLSEEVESQHRTLAEFGDRSPDAISKDLQRYREQIRELEDKLGLAPSLSLIDEYQELKTTHDSQVELLRERERRLAAQGESLNRAQIAVTELETIRDERRVLQQHKRLLEAKIGELESRIEAFIEGEAGKSPFPECRRMDEDPRRQTAPAIRSRAPGLKTFVKDLQARIAWQSSQRSGGRTLYYSERDLRCFVAGMAMSPLHILQGISGTGKTSLPCAFAEATGAGHKVIAVQAGWRDREDLLGHYNTFEKRYYEKEFLQALYEAQMPEFADRLYIIVLDEMNLSHPEQYFADLLSELEKPDVASRRIDLMTAQVPAAPARFVDGRRVSIPENVWFVGTANHDETTKDFADKTYDRAHVMELPRHREDFDVKKTLDVEPLGAKALFAAFKKAQDSNRRDAEKAYEFLDLEFADLLGDLFGLSWGNRLERQARLFVPVVMAAGGTPAEAVDHLMATKILRKLQNRHDIRPDYLEQLRDALVKATAHSDLMGNEKLAHCDDLVAAELRRLGVGED